MHKRIPFVSELWHVWSCVLGCVCLCSVWSLLSGLALFIEMTFPLHAMPILVCLRLCLCACVCLCVRVRCDRDKEFTVLQCCLSPSPPHCLSHVLPPSFHPHPSLSLTLSLCLISTFFPVSRFPSPWMISLHLWMQCTSLSLFHTQFGADVLSVCSLLLLYVKTIAKFRQSEDNSSVLPQSFWVHLHQNWEKLRKFSYLCHCYLPQACRYNCQALLSVCMCVSISFIPAVLPPFISFDLSLFSSHSPLLCLPFFLFICWQHISSSHIVCARVSLCILYSLSVCVSVFVCLWDRLMNLPLFLSCGVFRWRRHLTCVRLFGAGACLSCAV